MLTIRNLENNHLCVTSLHMSQCHFWVDGMTTRHTENLQICVLAVTFIHLQTEPKQLNHKCYLCSSSAASDGKTKNVPDFDQTHRELTMKKQLQQKELCNWTRAAHLLVLLNRLLLGLGDDALQLEEASLHLCEAHPGVMLFPSDALQLLLAVFLCDAGTLLPLLDTLREDLIDPAVDQNAQILMNSYAKKTQPAKDFSMITT